MQFIKWALGLISIAFWACQNEPKNVSELTPEMVIRNWQTKMDNNDIAGARTLSSENTKKWLDGIEAAIGDDTLHIKTEFVSIKCEVQNDNKAVCRCISKQSDINESYEDVFFLVKEKGQWLIELDAEESLEDGLFSPIKKDSLQ